MTYSWLYDRQKLAKVRSALLAGFGIRGTTREVGFGSNVTVAKYRRYLLAGGHDLRCPCGLRDDHRGWCRVRYERSPKRKAALAKLHAEQKRGMHLRGSSSQASS